MSTDVKDLKIARQVTANLVKDAGHEITILRSSDTPDGAGGFISGSMNPAPGEPKRRYVGGINYNHVGFDQNTTVGEQRRFIAVIVGLHTDHFEEGDEFVYDGNRYRVRMVMAEKREIEAKAECEWLREEA